MRRRRCRLFCARNTVDTAHGPQYLVATNDTVMATPLNTALLRLTVGTVHCVFHIAYLLRGGTPDQHHSLQPDASAAMSRAVVRCPRSSGSPALLLNLGQEAAIFFGRRLSGRIRRQWHCDRLFILQQLSQGDSQPAAKGKCGEGNGGIKASAKGNRNHGPVAATGQHE